MEKEKSKIEQITEAIDDVKNCLIADLAAKEKIIEVNREKTKTHYALLKSKERLAGLERELSN